MKGIILSGGLGSRLRPITNVVSKQLLPVYDKPMIYYSLSVLIRAGIKDIALITTNSAVKQFAKLLGDGKRFGVNMEYITQTAPNGIAESFLLAEDFIDGDSVCLILGDNIFHGSEEIISDCIQSNHRGCTLFGYRVKNPRAYGVAELDKFGNITGIEEKPTDPKSDVSITGLYVYDSTAVERVKLQKPSARGELEITDLNNSYIEDKSARLFTLPDGVAWLDMGSPVGLLQASNYVQTIQDRQGIQVGSPEICAFKNRMIGTEEFLDSYNHHKDTAYGESLKKVIDEDF